MTQRPASDADTLAAAEVYFDGGCPICSREIALYRRLADEEGPAFRDISASTAAPAADLEYDAAMARFHVRRRDGTLVSGAAAFLALWRATPRLRLVGRVLSIPPLPLLLEGGYRLFLRVRPIWQKPTQRLPRSDT